LRATYVLVVVIGIDVVQFELAAVGFVPQCCFETAWRKERKVRRKAEANAINCVGVLRDWPL